MEEMANYNKPQRRGNSLPCNVPDVFRHRRCHGAFHPDTTRGAERHEQQYCNPVTVHPTRDHSRPADDSLFLSPFAFAFANYFIPLQIGARDPAFPRLNSMSYWFYFFSGIAMGLSFLIGAPNTGWTLYAPLTDRGCGGGLCTALGGFDLGAIGLVLMVTSITMSSVNFIVTILKMRAPGMKLKFMPLFSWTVL